MIADGGNNGRDLLRWKIHPVQDSESHHCAALAVIHTVDHIADIVQISGNPRKLHGSCGVAQGFQNVPGGFRHPGHMGKAVLRKPQGLHGGIGLGNVHLYRRVPTDFFIGHSFFLSLNTHHRYIVCQRTVKPSRQLM